MAFIRVHNIPWTGEYSNPLDMWAGLDGAGVHGALWLSTGRRKPAGGRGAGLWAHTDSMGDTHWPLIFLNGMETANKIRDYREPSGAHVLLTYFEANDLTGSVILKRRSDGSTSFESIPKSGNTVGGRGLATNIWSSAFVGDLYAAQNPDWTSGSGELWRRPHDGGGWTRSRRYGSGELIWEVEYAPDALWEFVTEFRGGTSYGYRNGSRFSHPDCRSAMYAPLTGHMYITSGLDSATGRVYRSRDGRSWEQVFNAAGRLDHVKYIPRGSGEIWLVGFDPFTIYKSTNGTTFTLEHQGAFDTLTDTNHMSALAYYNNRVWAACTDADARTIAIFREDASSDPPAPDAPLAAPTLTSPTNGAATSRAPTFAWTPVTGATAYRLMVSTLPTVRTNPNLASCGHCVISIRTTATSYTPPANTLAPDTIYHWQVRANRPVTGGEWSALFGLTTGANDPDIPPVVTPEFSVARAPRSGRSDAHSPFRTRTLRDLTREDVNAILVGLNRDLTQLSTELATMRGERGAESRIEGPLNLSDQELREVNRVLSTRPAAIETNQTRAGRVRIKRGDAGARAIVENYNRLIDALVRAGVLKT